MIGVIGGSGFIGTALTRALLARGSEVRILDRQESSAFPELWVKVDVRDRQALVASCRELDALYLLAAEHRDDVRPVSLYHDVNVGGTANVCAAAEAHGIQRIIFTSSVAIYGSADHELDEAAPARPFNEYGRTKLEAEGVVSGWRARQPGRSLTIVRPTVVFGPGNRGNVYNLLDQIQRGRAIVVGNGHNRKSMAYVDNVADFLVFSSTFGPGVHVFNYVDKPDLTMNELIALTIQTLGLGIARPIHIPVPLALAAGRCCDLLSAVSRRSLPLSAVRVRKYCANTQFASGRMRAAGFVARHSLREALTHTIRTEFERNPGARKCTPLSNEVPDEAA